MQNQDYLQLNSILNSMYEGRPLLLQPMGFPLSLSAALAAGATQTQQLTITGNADFLLTVVGYRATVAGAAQTVSGKTAAQVRILMTDSSSGNQFTQGPVDIENFCTNGAYGRGFSWPRLLRGRSSVTVQLTNYGTEVYSALELFLDGVLVQVVSNKVN